jgi:hypothetical protein
LGTKNLLYTINEIAGLGCPEADMGGRQQSRHNRDWERFNADFHFGELLAITAFWGQVMSAGCGPDRS